MKQIVLIAFVLLFACNIQAALPRDKFLTKEGKLTATLTLKDAQGGFVGITGLVWTVRPDGSWGSETLHQPHDAQGRLAGQIDSKATTVLGRCLGPCAGG